MLSRSEKEEERKKSYVARARQIQQKSAMRMGYPVTGAISGEFTFFGWRRERNEVNSTKKLIDTRCLGVVPDSPSDTLMINIGGQLQVSQHGLPIEPVRSGAWQVEIDILYMFADYFKIAREEIRGYVTTGGTEGNLAGLWWAREYLKSKFSLAPILYLSDQAHYSIYKIANILSLTTCVIPTDQFGAMNCGLFLQFIRDHIQKDPQRPIMICATVGTTQMGGIDAVPILKQILTDELPVGNYTIHVDAALLGAVMPIIKPFGMMDQYFNCMDTIAISGHKFLGTTSICGVVLAKKDLLEHTYSDKNILVKYVGGIQDTTVTGTRSGKIVMELHHAMCSLDMNSDYARLRKMVTQCLANVNYLRTKLSDVVGMQNIIYNSNQFTIVFPKPLEETSASYLEDKYGLMSVMDTQFAICVLAPVDKILIDDFLSDYLACFNAQMKRELRACL